MKNKYIELKEVKFEEIKQVGLQLYNPTFKTFHIDQLKFKTRDYSDFYNTGVFCRETSTIHLYR